MLLSSLDLHPDGQSNTSPISLNYLLVVYGRRPWVQQDLRMQVFYVSDDIWRPVTNTPTWLGLVFCNARITRVNAFNLQKGILDKIK